MSTAWKPTLGKAEASALMSVLEGKQVLALVELGLLDKVRNRMRSAFQKRIAESLSQSLFADRSAAAAAIGPLLLEVQGTEEVEWLVRFAQPLHAVSWIVPRQPLASIRSNLTTHLDATTDDGLRFLLRYYDPWLLEAYCALVDPLDWQHALHGIAQWHWVNPWGELCSLDVPESDQPTLRKNAIGHTYLQPVNAQQLGCLTRLCEPGALLDALRTRVPAALAAWARPSEHALASYLLRVAYAHGLETLARQAAYALDALQIHPLLHTHPWVQSQLSEGASLDTVADAMSPEQRERVRNELHSGMAAQSFKAPFGYAHQPLGRDDLTSPENTA